MNNWSLFLTFGLVLIALMVSYREKIGLEKDMLIGSLRAVVQLSVIGLVLKFVFNIDSILFTSIILLLMVYNAATVAAKRGQGLRNV